MESKAESPTTLDSSGSTLTVDKPPTCWDTLLLLWNTALGRCWPSLIVLGIWSSSICLFNHFTNGKLSIQPTLITVFGTILGFVISFRTSHSFDRYNEGQKLWSQIVLNCRIFARTVWFQVPDNIIPVPATDCPSLKAGGNSDQDQAKIWIEKKMVVNLLEAYAIATKDYLRGEKGTGYEDLKLLVPFLSSFSVPTTQVPASSNHLLAVPGASSRPFTRGFWMGSTIAPPNDQEALRPAELGPKYCWETAWANFKKLCMLGVNDPTHPSHKFRPKKDNIPLEISMYLTSYVCKLRACRTVDEPTLALLYATLNQLVDALTGLERILTTPIPFSSSLHLWVVTMAYCAALPFQLWSTLEWFTVPASVIASFVFCGVIAAGEDIENPSGYDKNDLNIGYIVDNIIRKELRAIAAVSIPDLTKRAFPDNIQGVTPSKGGLNETLSDQLD